MVVLAAESWLIILHMFIIFVYTFVRQKACYILTGCSLLNISAVCDTIIRNISFGRYTTSIHYFYSYIKIPSEALIYKN
jgi:hypothetical protein